MLQLSRIGETGKHTEFKPQRRKAYLFESDMRDHYYYLELVMETQAFIESFNASFDKNLKALQKAEKFTKELVKGMSRDVLLALHITQDSGKVNQFVNALTPVNRKVAILFYKEFSGFKHDEDEGFGKKDKKAYDKAAKKSSDALEDPHFNLWTWADKHIDVTKKPLKLADVTKYVQRILKSAAEQGIDQSEVIKAILDGGLEFDTLLKVIDAIPATHEAEQE